MKTHQYDVINASHFKDLRTAINVCADQGWRIASVIGSRGPGYADVLVVERPVEKPTLDFVTTKPGIWVAYYGDFSGLAVFDNETAARLYAEGRSMIWAKVKLGVDLRAHGLI